MMTFRIKRSLIELPDPSGLELQEEPEFVERSFELIRRMDFNSDRKRMSIVVRDQEDGLVKLYCKGADNVILERLDFKQTDQHLLAQSKAFIRNASTNGLRTLAMGMRVLDDVELASFLLGCEEAEESLQNKERELEMLYSDIERNLIMLGATAVEDRLQDKVPDTIADLQKAGIKVWMLTGDKAKLQRTLGMLANCLKTICTSTT